MLTSWDGIGAGLRQREIAATWAWRLLSIWVVSVAAVPVVESEETVGWLLSWVGDGGGLYPATGWLGADGGCRPRWLVVMPGVFLDFVFH